MNSLAERIEALAASPLARLDPLGVDLVTKLHARASAAPEAVRERLSARIEAQLIALDARASAARERAVQAIEAVERDGVSAALARTRLGRGDAIGARRTALRLAIRPMPERTGEAALRERLTRFAAGLGVSLRGTEKIPATRLANRLFRIASSAPQAERVVELAQAARPEGAGRYHTDTVAADILAMMHALSPAYLRAQVARLEMLAEAQAFVMRGEAPKPEEAPKPARKSRAKKK
jgi:hypothetical protein